MDVEVYCAGDLEICISKAIVWRSPWSTQATQPISLGARGTYARSICRSESSVSLQGRQWKPSPLLYRLNNSKRSSSLSDRDVNLYYKLLKNKFKHEWISSLISYPLRLVNLYAKLY